MDRATINTLGLCAGVGMLDLGVAVALEHLGYRPRATALCEWEAYAAACLLERMEDEALEPCPIWCGDLRGFDARPFRGVVDVIAAGLPCQPYSVAGKQQGNSDARSHGEDGSGPIPQFLRIVSECRPAVVFCENVPPWVRDGWFRPVGEELSRMGYKIEDPLFITAESVGASHKRERVFVMAHDKSVGLVARRAESTRLEGCIATSSGGAVADAMRTERPERAGRERVFDDGADVGNASRSRTKPLAAGSGSRSAIGESGVDLFAPGPCDFDGWDRVVEDGSFDFRAPSIKPGVRVLVDGTALVVDASRADQLRCGGNGCVPLQAAVAFVELFREAMNRSDMP